MHKVSSNKINKQNEGNSTKNSTSSVKKESSSKVKKENENPKIKKIKDNEKNIDNAKYSENKVNSGGESSAKKNPDPEKASIKSRPEPSISNHSRLSKTNRLKTYNEKDKNGFFSKSKGKGLRAQRKIFFELDTSCGLLLSNMLEIQEKVSEEFSFSPDNYFSELKSYTGSLIWFITFFIYKHERMHSLKSTDYELKVLRQFLESIATKMFKIAQVQIGIEKCIKKLIQEGRDRVLVEMQKMLNKAMKTKKTLLKYHPNPVPTIEITFDVDLEETVRDRKNLEIFIRLSSGGVQRKGSSWKNFNTFKGNESFGYIREFLRELETSVLALLFRLYKFKKILQRSTREETFNICGRKRSLLHNLHKMDFLLNEMVDEDRNIEESLSMEDMKAMSDSVMAMSQYLYYIEEGSRILNFQVLDVLETFILSYQFLSKESKIPVALYISDHLSHLIKLLKEEINKNAEINANTQFTQLVSTKELKYSSQRFLLNIYAVYLKVKPTKIGRKDVLLQNKDDPNMPTLHHIQNFEVPIQRVVRSH